MEPAISSAAFPSRTPQPRRVAVGTAGTVGREAGAWLRSGQGDSVPGL